MANTTQNEYQPDLVTPPGDTLRETLSAMAMSQAELAERMGRAKKTVNEIVRGKAPITPDTALQLERVLGIPAGFWNRREQHYREYLARLRERNACGRHAEWLRQFPIGQMARRGWMTRRADEADQVRELLSFFGVASPEQWQLIWGAGNAAFRRSRAFEADPAAVAAWLRQGELEAHRVTCAPYDEQSFRDVLGNIRELTAEPPNKGLPTAASMCGSAGVAVVVVRELPGTRAWGATRWLKPDKALLQLSCRYKRDDHLWFTFFHEAAHILRHGKRLVFVEDGANDEASEEEADRYAQDSLIPDADYRSFVAEYRPFFSKVAIRAFAGRIRVSPGIVVGRLQHDGLLPQTHCNDLKRAVSL
jgi:addiction module HigA family antidote